MSPIWVWWLGRGVQVIPLLCVDVCTGADWYTAAVTGECIGGAPTRRPRGYVLRARCLVLELVLVLGNVQRSRMLSRRS
jgi:hypothetical protein